MVVDGAPIVALGNVLATEKVILGPTAGDGPPTFDADPEAMDMPRLPSPVMLEIVILRDFRPVPVTVTTPFAVSVRLRVTSAGERLTAVAPV